MMKVIIRIIFIALVLISSLLFFSYILLKGSLSHLSGTFIVNQLEHPVNIERDVLGIPTIQGKSRLDVALALGFLHAQDRFFQMDLMRRASAGEISELFGKDALDFDKERRFHRFRSKAKILFENLSIAEQNLLKAYTIGVNEGMRMLTIRPFEYIVLATTPMPWIPEDSILVCLGLFFELQDSRGEGEMKRALMKTLLPNEVYHFFVHNGSKWEAALDHSHLPILEIPDRRSFTYLKENQESRGVLTLEPSLGGSNQWAVTKDKSYDGKALLACDMHLALSVPNIWYRAAFHYEDEELYKIYGVTLPGMPLMIIGSNTHIAWGFTNAHIRTCEMVPVDRELLKKVTEVIFVKGEDPVLFDIKETECGPIVPDSYGELPQALNWIAYTPDSINMRLIELEKAKNVYQALETSKKIKIPVQNFMVVDSSSNIAWTLIGTIPNIDVSTYPTIINPSINSLWTANNRSLGNDWLLKVGSESFLNGIRAYQISQKLLYHNKATPEEMLSFQMDIQAPFFERWQRLMLDTLKKSPHNQSRQDLMTIVRSWDKQSHADSSAYYWIREFRQKVSEAILKRLLAPCLKYQADFFNYFQDFEEPVWLIAHQQPEYLMGSQFTDWNEELISYIDDMLISESRTALESETWGNNNTLKMQHPFSLDFPLLGYFLDMQALPMSGDYYGIKVAYSNDGASQRMVISPGAEDKGIFHMPGGQSGHPLSPFYKAGHEAWFDGTPSPFLPGDSFYKLEMLPFVL